MSGVLARVAGAPISWGVCEVPGWGHQMGRDRVLSEMRAAGLVASEFGPDGFLPVPAAERAGVLSSYGLACVGGFVPVVLHDAGLDPVAGLAPVLEAFVAAGAGTLVLAADSGRADYDGRVLLDGAEWMTLCANLDAVSGAAADHGITAALHPHVGTLVERAEDVSRVLEQSAVALCLDTGHLLIGGTDPAELAATVPDRVVHTHLKDVDSSYADRVRAGELSYTAAVGQGMYRPLGSGDIDIAVIVRGLEATGYQGWYVMEQDTILAAEPAAGAGPEADVRASLAFLAGVAV